MDCINIRNLRIHAIHGVFPEEKKTPQLFLVSAALYLDLHGAGVTDDLKKTIDYGHVCENMLYFVQSESFDLIETVAERLAEKLLGDYPMLKKVKIEINKPHAPISAELDTVSVEIERSRHVAYISTGTNMGDKEANLQFAIDSLNDAKNCSVTRASGFILTAPYGKTDQDDFLNACIELETLSTPNELLAMLGSIENAAGRERRERWGPRRLDLDIIFYDDIVLYDANLRIPHEEMHKRRFVLEPLCEIAPYKLHPVLRKTVKELLDELKVES